MRFRKRPVVVEAEQYHPGGGTLGVMGDDPDKPCGCSMIGGPADRPHVHTAHNGQAVLVEPGDWIVAEPDGRGFYPVRPAIFAATYEPASE